MSYDDSLPAWLISHWQWWLAGVVLYLALGLAIRYDRREPEGEEERSKMEQLKGTEWVIAVPLTLSIIFSVAVFGSVVFLLVKFVKWAWYH